jgi:hypothetical protein
MSQAPGATVPRRSTPPRWSSPRLRTATVPGNEARRPMRPGARGNPRSRGRHNGNSGRQASAGRGSWMSDVASSGQTVVVTGKTPRQEGQNWESSSTCSATASSTSSVSVKRLRRLGPGMTTGSASSSRCVTERSVSRFLPLSHTLACRTGIAPAVARSLRRWCGSFARAWAGGSWMPSSRECRTSVRSSRPARGTIRLGAFTNEPVSSTSRT